MVLPRRSTRRGFVGLLAMAAACGGNAFHVDHDGGGGSASLAGATSVAGDSQGGSSSSSSGAGAVPSGARAGSGGRSPTNGGAGNEAGSPATSGGEAGSGGDPDLPPPISTEGLVYWFKADAGVEEKSGRIERWADQSGNAQHALQGLSTQRPLLTQTDQLPLPVVELDGNTFLELPPIDAPIDGGLTFFAIAGRSGDSPCAAIVELSNGKEIDDVFFGHGGVAMHFEVADVWFDSAAQVFDVGVIRQVTYKQAGDATTATAVLSANGAFVGSQEVPFPLRKRREQNFIGLTQYDNCSKFIGRVGEIILYSRVLGREEQRSVERYLLEKWRLPDDAP